MKDRKRDEIDIVNSDTQYGTQRKMYGRNNIKKRLIRDTYFPQNRRDKITTLKSGILLRTAYPRIVYS